MAFRSLFTPIRRIVLIIAACLSIGQLHAYAQVNAPVMATVQLNPPYSLYLSDYAAPDVQRLQVHLLLKDLVETNYRCRLRLTIEGFGITLQSKASFYTPAILLNGGEMQTISGPELAGYLNPKNLVLQGLDYNEFIRNGSKLPEGIYKFTVEVLDYNRNTVISNAAFAIVSTFLSYPPIINTPMAGTKVDAFNPQNIVFQWMPRHTASLNAAFNVAYKFRLVELIPVTRNPNDAMRTTRPILETMTSQTMLVYGPAEPMLTPGSHYAVQVQAIEAEGRDMFINEGYSEVVPFIYGEKCSVPGDLLAAVSSVSNLKVSWTSQSSQQAFTVRYREAGERPSQWYEQDVYGAQAILTGLKQGKKYEYQVRAQCIWGYGDYSAVQAFTMPDAALQQGDFVCGRASDVGAISNRENIKQLQAEDTITAGDFKVILTTVSGSNGSFSGTGRVMVPFLQFLTLDVTFSNIRVNTTKQLYDGIIQIRQDDPGKVSGDLQKTLTELVDKIDNALAAGDLPAIQTMDAAAMLKDISKIKGWDELSPEVKEALTELEGKLKEVQAIQQNNNLTPAEKATLAEKLAKDIKTLTDKIKGDLQAMLDVVKQFLGLFRSAQKKVNEVYPAPKLDELKTLLDQEEKQLDEYIKAQRAAFKATPAEEDDYPVIVVEEKGAALPEGSTQTSPAGKYKAAEKAFNRIQLLRMLCNEQLPEEQVALILSHLKVKEVAGADYLKQAKKSGTQDNTVISDLSDAIIQLADQLLKEKIYKGQ